MNPGIPLSGLLLLFALVIHSAAEQSPFGIVHGPKAAFNLAAPEGWVIDNSAYIQLPKAVAYIVYTADDERRFRQHQSALEKLLKTFAYLEVKP